MKQGDRVIGLLSLGLSFWLIYGSSDLKYMTEYKPGPGFLPFWIGAIFGLLGLMLIINTFVRKNEEEVKQLPGTKSLLRVGGVLLILMAFSALMMVFGFILTTFLFVFTILLMLERYNVFQSALWALLFSSFVYAVFIYAMQVDLPAGFLGF